MPALGQNLTQIICNRRRGASPFKHSVNVLAGDRCQGSSRFTLIELLVVMIIIAILAALLLPSLSASRDMAKKSACSANMQQLGLSLAMYMSDNEDHYPTTSWDFNGRVVWDDIISGYDGRPGLPHNGALFADQESALLTRSIWGQEYAKVYHCPDDTFQRMYGTSPDCYARSYSITNMVYFPGAGYEAANYLGISGWNNGTWQRVTRKSSGLIRASETIVLGEIHSGGNLIGNGWKDEMIANGQNSQQLNGYWAHGRSANYLIADGHVEAPDYYDTLIRPDGTIAIPGSTVANTMWDASPNRN